MKAQGGTGGGGMLWDTADGNQVLEKIARQAQVAKLSMEEFKYVYEIIAISGSGGPKVCAYKGGQVCLACLA